MNIIGIETATTRLSAALRTADGLVTERHTDTRSSHCELLTGYIHDLTVESGLSMDDIGCIAVSIGPGSFTGLRIGIATAMGLAYGLGIPACSVNTLMGLARNAAVPEGLVCPVIDAKRSEVYSAVYRIGGNMPHEVLEPSALPVEKLKTALLSFSQPVTITGPAVEIYGELLSNDSDGLISCVPHHDARATARSIVELGNQVVLATGGTSPSSLKPLYLRRSDAEILRDSC